MVLQVICKCVYFFVQATVHKKEGGQAQRPVHYGHAKEQEDSREY